MPQKNDAFLFCHVFCSARFWGFFCRFCYIKKTPKMNCSAKVVKNTRLSYHTCIGTGCSENLLFFDSHRNLAILIMQQKTPNAFGNATCNMVCTCTIYQNGRKKFCKFQLFCTFSRFFVRNFGFFDFFKKKCKKVILLENALIFEKKIFHL